MAGGDSDATLSATIAAELDPEAVRLALCPFVQLLVNAKRERDDALATTRQIKAKLTEADQLHESRKVHMLVAQVKEQLKRYERERHALAYKIASLERAF